MSALCPVCACAVWFLPLPATSLHLASPCVARRLLALTVSDFLSAHIPASEKRVHELVAAYTSLYDARIPTAAIWEVGLRCGSTIGTTLSLCAHWHPFRAVCSRSLFPGGDQADAVGARQRGRHRSPAASGATLRLSFFRSSVTLCVCVLSCN